VAELVLLELDGGGRGDELLADVVDGTLLLVAMGGAAVLVGGARVALLEELLDDGGGRCVFELDVSTGSEEVDDEDGAGAEVDDEGEEVVAGREVEGEAVGADEDEVERVVAGTRVVLRAARCQSLGRTHVERGTHELVELSLVAMVLDEVDLRVRGSVRTFCRGEREHRAPGGRRCA